VKSDCDGTIRILRQDSGQFGRRFQVGPVRWPHFDLLWLHEGGVVLEIGSSEKCIKLIAPSGALIFPKTLISGRAIGDFASASICHFVGGSFEGSDRENGFLLPYELNAFHVQNLIQLSLEYARRGVSMALSEENWLKRAGRTPSVAG
jgi:hypothetical protein